VVNLVALPGAKVLTQDLYGILPLAQRFSNIVGGVYWRPVFNLLEAHRAVVLVNPRHMRAVPGRKTDVKDAEWLADLLAHGLLQPSFIPPAPVRALRELMRYRTSLVQARTQEITGDQPRAQGTRAGQH
jgi:transposase